MHGPESKNQDKYALSFCNSTIVPEFSGVSSTLLIMLKTIFSNLLSESKPFQPNRRQNSESIIFFASKSLILISPIFS
jgi:hypothetical protein